MKFLFLFAFLLCSAPAVWAQASISGYIKDSQDQPMVSANVLLLQPSDSSLVKGSITRIDGSYEISKYHYTLFIYF